MPHAVTEGYWRRRLLEIATFLTEEALSSDLLERLLTMIARDLPGQSALLDYEPNEQRIEFAGYGFDDTAKRAYEAHFHSVNPISRSLLQYQLFNRTFVASRWLDRDTFFRTEFYNDWLRPRGERYALVMSIGYGNGSRTGFPIYRGEREGGEFTIDEVRRLDSLRPFLKNALLLRRWVRRFAPGELSTSSVAEAREQLRKSADSGSMRVWFVGQQRQTWMRVFSRRYGLSDREAEVASLLADGQTYMQVAGALHISYHTVNTHVKSILRKLDLSSIRLLPRLLLEDTVAR